MMLLRSERRCSLRVSKQNGVQKVAAIDHTSLRVSTHGSRLSRCGRVSKWRRRSGSLLKEVCKDGLIYVRKFCRTVIFKDYFSLAEFFLLRTFYERL